MSAQPNTPTVGAQPTPPIGAPRFTLPEGAHLAQPTSPNHAQSAQWAFRTALGFWLTAVIVDWAGAQPEGIAGIVLGVGALGVSVASAHAHDRVAQSGQPTVTHIVDEAHRPDADKAFAEKLTELALRSRSSRSLGGAA